MEKGTQYWLIGQTEEHTSQRISLLRTLLRRQGKPAKLKSGILIVSEITKVVKFGYDLINALQHGVPVETVESIREVQLCNDVVIWHVRKEAPSGLCSGPQPPGTTTSS